MHDDDMTGRYWWRDRPEPTQPQPCPTTDVGHVRKFVGDYAWPILFVVLGFLAILA